MKVYVISSSAGCCKIGITIDVQKRLGGLVTGHPYPLEIAHSFEVPDDQAREIERMAHGRLAAHRMQGEWFKVSREDAIEAVRHALDPIYNASRSPERCGSCRYARFRSCPDGEWFECRLSPPVIEGWPHVDADDWCTKFTVGPVMSDMDDDI